MIFRPNSPTPFFLARDVTHLNISHRVWISWTPNTLRIPKMYTFMGIWAILEELLTFEVIATLRYMKQTNKIKIYEIP